MLHLIVFGEAGPSCTASSPVCHPSKNEGIPLSALLKGTTSKLASFFPRYLFVLSVTQGSREYRFIKYSVCLDKEITPRSRLPTANHYITARAPAGVNEGDDDHIAMGAVPKHYDLEVGLRLHRALNYVSN